MYVYLSLGLPVKIVCLGYLLFKLWTFLFRRKAGGLWVWLFAKQKRRRLTFRRWLLMLLLQRWRRREAAAKERRRSKEAVRKQQPASRQSSSASDVPARISPAAPDGGQWSVVGKSKTVYLPEPPASVARQPAAGNESTGADAGGQKPQTASPAQGHTPQRGQHAPEALSPEARSASNGEAGAGKATSIEQSAEPPADPAPEPAFEGEGERTLTEEEMQAEDETDYSQCTPPGPDELSSGATFEELGNVAEVLQGGGDAPKRDRAAQTLHAIRDSDIFQIFAVNDAMLAMADKLIFERQKRGEEPPSDDGFDISRIV